MKILYAAGPGNVIQTYHYWLEGEDDPTQLAITYSGQFYSVCTELNLEGYLISSYPETQKTEDKKFRIEHRPIPFCKSKMGILYHLGQFWYGINLIISALRFQADVVIIVTGSTHLFLLFPLTKLGIRVTPLLQCVLWRKNQPISQFNRLLLRLNGYFLAKECYCAFSLSKDITNQVKEITNGKPPTIIEYLPIYRRQRFADLKTIDPNQTPFQILFAGRIEKNKGVFDLLEIAHSFLAEGQRKFVFNICGDGSQLITLQNLVKEKGLGSSFLCWGHCNHAQMRTMFNRSHIVVVPTTTNFVEGFNKVVVEGILSMRPVITSSVCPAINYVREGIIEVPPDDRNAYKKAILQLATDQELYKEKQQACLHLKEKFYDSSNGWGASLKGVLQEINKL